MRSLQGIASADGAQAICAAMRFETFSVSTHKGACQLHIGATQERLESRKIGRLPEVAKPSRVIR